MDSKKKRQMEGDHKRREDVDNSDDDDDFESGNGIKVYPDGSTFERAPPEELAKRKIFKMKPKNKPPAATPIPTATQSTTVQPSANPFSAFSIAKPAANSTTQAPSNPFAGFSFTTPASALTTAPSNTTTNTTSSNPFAGFSFTTPTSTSTTNKEEKKEEIKEEKKEEIKEEKKEDKNESTDIWVCPCCEQKNKQSDNNCTLCIAPKPVEKKKEEKKSEINTASLFSSNTPVIFNTAANSSSLFSSNTPVTFNTTTSSNIFSSLPTTSTNTTSLFGNATGFTFTPKVEEKKEEVKSDSNIWVCACCEQKNQLDAKQCSLCFANKPVEKKKEEKKPEINSASLFSSNTPVTFNTTTSSNIFSSPPTTSTNTTSLFGNATGFTFTPKVEEKKEVISDSNIWVCACCEQKNQLDAKQCSLCFANKPVEKKKELKEEKKQDRFESTSEKKPETNTGSLFSSNTPVIFNTTTTPSNSSSLFSSNTPVTFNTTIPSNSSSLFSSNTPVTFNTTTTPSSNIFSSQPTTSTNTTSLFSNTTGFTSSKIEEKKDQENNQLSSLPQAKEQYSIKPISRSELLSMNTSPKLEEWICPCCDKDNLGSSKTCAGCLIKRPQKKE